MSDYPIQHEGAAEQNYWCEQANAIVEKCNGGKQCWDCALIQGRMENEWREQAMHQYQKEQEYHMWVQNTYGYGYDGFCDGFPR